MCGCQESRQTRRDRRGTRACRADARWTGPAATPRTACCRAAIPSGGPGCSEVTARENHTGPAPPVGRYCRAAAWLCGGRVGGVRERYFWTVRFDDYASIQQNQTIRQLWPLRRAAAAAAANAGRRQAARQPIVRDQLRRWRASRRGVSSDSERDGQQHQKSPASELPCCLALGVAFLDHRHLHRYRCLSRAVQSYRTRARNGGAVNGGLWHVQTPATQFWVVDVRVAAGLYLRQSRSSESRLCAMFGEALRPASVLVCFQPSF